ncbi:MAG TPA: hypothetical protein VK462_04885 [Nitrososphaeraceae archaeon]|nr:hypothetical protein [Nitrososphaeraceae archaeon]
MSLKEARAMKETTTLLMRVDRKFLERIDYQWKTENFKTRTEYIMFLIRNDVAKDKVG